MLRCFFEIKEEAKDGDEHPGQGWRLGPKKPSHIIHTMGCDASS